MPQILMRAAKLIVSDHASRSDARFKRRVQAIIGAVILSMTIIGVAIHFAVKQTLTDYLVETLQTVLEADVEALSIWIEKKKSIAVLLAKDPRIVSLVQDLIELRDQQPESGKGLLNSAQLMELRMIFQESIYSFESPFFAVSDRKGVIATQQDNSVGMVLSPSGSALVTRVLQGETLFLKPKPEGSLVANYSGDSDSYWTGVVVPLRRDNGEIIAALFLGMRPEEDFSRILSIARIGTGGDTYAFDEQGTMLSDTRHTQQLKAIGLIPDRPEARSIDNVQIRDPGGDLTRGFAPELPRDGWPLTRMVATAIANKQELQFLLEPYRDYRGVQVVGAAQWLPDYGFGIATEVQFDEALASLRPLELAAYGLTAALVVLALIIIYYTFVIQTLDRRYRDIKKLGQYTPVKLLGEGGMGKVYLANHAHLKRLTAVKFLPEEKVKHETLVRFEREVQTTSQLTHPNTVQIYDYGRTPEGIFYYAMEYLPGMTLTRLVEIERTLTAQRAIYLLKQICASLEEAHSMGLIHRDIKPLNIMTCIWGIRADVIKVLDFGLVKEVAANDATQLTMHNVILGTPGYYAPERLLDPDKIDHRVDLYGIGAIAFNLLTGQDVFGKGDTAQTLIKVIEAQPQPPSCFTDNSIPKELDRLVVECLAKNPDDRPQSARKIWKRLQRIEKKLDPWTQDDAIKWWDIHGKEAQSNLSQG